MLQKAGCGRSLPSQGAGLLGEVSGCPALVPEAACGPGHATGTGAWSWLCAERLSLGGLLQEPGGGRCLLPEGAGLLGGVSGCPSLVPEVTCRPESTAGSGVWIWLSVEMVSLGGLLPEAGGGTSLPPEVAGLLG